MGLAQVLARNASSGMWPNSKEGLQLWAKPSFTTDVEKNLQRPPQTPAPGLGAPVLRLHTHPASPHNWQHPKKGCG